MRFRLLILFLLLYPALHAQTQWVLKKNEDGIKVYTAHTPNSNIKSVKVECTLHTTIAKLATYLMNAKAHEQWVYGTKTSYTVKMLGEYEQLYYSEIDMPSPLKNRDVVTRLKLSQPASNILTVSAIAEDGHVAPRHELVRIPMSVVNWEVTATGNNELQVVYTAQADPGGAIPAWVVNLFCVKGPFETFSTLRSIVAGL